MIPESMREWARHGNEMRRPLLMPSEASNHSEFTIVGGGLSGMCTALRLANKSANIKVRLIEKSDRLGGVIDTWSIDGWLCDVAVNASRPHPAVWRLMSDLGLDESWNLSNEEAKSRWIYLKGKRHKLGPSSALKMGPFSLLKGLKRAKKGGASLADIVNNPNFANAISHGITNAKAHEMDADILAPQMTKFGPASPLKKKQLAKILTQTYPEPDDAPPRGRMASLDLGMQQLIDALEAQLHSMHNVEILVSKQATLSEIKQEFELEDSQIIWANPTLPSEYESAFSRPGSFNEMSAYVVGYSEEQASSVPIGYGMLNPDASICVSGILHESDVHSGQRAPKGSRLFRLMVPHYRFDGKDETVLADFLKLYPELKDVGEPQIFVKLGDRVIPNHPPGHLQRIAQLELPFTWIGWGASGVSLMHVVDQAERVAENIN